jgi:uncharacterized membrane protein
MLNHANPIKKLVLIINSNSKVRSAEKSSKLLLCLKNELMIIPLMTLFVNIAILINIPILREIIVFIFLSLIPGFAILKLLNLKEISFLETVLLSAALSIGFVMFCGLLVNELFGFLSISNPLSLIPLTLTISAFTLFFFLLAFMRNRPVKNLTLTSEKSQNNKPKNMIALFTFLFLFPIFSIIGVLFHNIFLILLSDALIAILCVMVAVYKRIIPEKLFPLLILSISVALVCQVPFTSKYIEGWDANLEYYVFSMTQLHGQWGSLNASINSVLTLNYNSMLSITLLPAVYSVLMHAQGEIVFKILYPLIFVFVPLTLYRICEKQFGKMTGLFSALFFVFTSTAFYGPEILSLNRQIIGELFLVLSIFILINKTIPPSKRRLLLIIFGASLAVSHYALAYFYLFIVAFIFIISKVKPKFNDTFNSRLVLTLFAITFAWYTVGSNAPLTSLANTVKGTITEFTMGLAPNQAGSTIALFGLPQIFTISTWINLLLSGIVNLLLVLGIIFIFLRPKRTGIFLEYTPLILISTIVLAASFIAPSIAAILNFTRFYGIVLLFLSCCLVFGGQALLSVTEPIGKIIRKNLKICNITKRKNNVYLMHLLIAIILAAYFLSQSGFVNRVTQSSIHFYSIDYDKMIASDQAQIKVNLYSNLIPYQDIFSASWLSNYKAETKEVYSDWISGNHVLLSYGLIPNKLLIPITNTTIPLKGSLIYLGSLNKINGIITTSSGALNISDTSILSSQSSIVYSNGASEIWYTAPY